MRKVIIMMVACLLGAASAFAVPAKRVPTTITQSDGTKVTITMMGDEWSHSYVTSDFKTVGIGNDGDVYYRTSSGLSNVRAHEIVQRNAAELGFLSKNTAIMGLDALTKSNPRSKARSMSYTNPMKVGSTQVPTTGTPRVPVIVIEYSDKKCSNPLSTFTSNYTSGSSSVYQYFYDQSNGLYRPQYDVYGIYNLNKTRATYGGNDSSGNDVGVAQMVYDAVIASNSDIDWTQYDNDGDGEADVVIVVYAGVGEAQASSTVPNSIWPCQWTLASGNYYGDGPGSVTLDGIKIDRFGVFNEINGSKDNGTQIDGIGTFCHEFSHCLGLPDFYDTGSGNYYYGIGSWSLMDYGSYNNNGYTPIGYSAYEKNFMGWINLLTPTENSFYTLPKFNQKSASTDIAYKVTSPLNSNEYYILENRAQQGWDSYIADEGLMVTHVTYVASRWSANTVNKQAIQLFTIIPADNTLSDYNEETDLYGESNHSLTDATTPAAKLNMNSSGTLPNSGAGYMGKPLTEINLNSDGTVSFWYIKGNEPHFAPVLNDATNVQNTSFTASWTDETEAQYVSSYDLQVNEQGSSTSNVYSLVSSASSLSNGDKIIIVDETASKAAGAISNNVLVAKDVTISNSSITDPEDVEVFTLVANGANWKLANSEGQYLTSTTAKKVSYTNSGTSVSISISSGSATIDFGTAGKILYNNGSPRFTTYTSNATSTMRLPKIYKLSSGASNAPLRASETGGASNRTITGITAKSYTVSGLNEGRTYNFKVRANYADGSQSDWTATKSVTLSGTAELNPFIVADEAINFSEVTVGESSTKVLNILAEELKGDVTLTLNDTNNVFSLATTTVSKADAEEGAAVNVTFAPAAAQNYSATVTVSSEDAEPVVVTLSGTGLPAKETPQFTGDATDITTSSFNVAWNAVDYAASYTLDVTRTGEESYVYALVTNANDLADGDKIIIVSTSKGKAAGALSGTFLAPENVTVSNDVISELTEGIEVFTLVADGSNWKLANSEGQYLTSTTAKTVSYTSSGTSTTVTISGGDATISFGDAGRILYNNTNPRFTTYTSNTSASMLLPQIYKRVPASANASETGDEAHKVITGITDTNYTVEGLTAGATYSCKVKAVYLDETESEWSTALSVTLEEEQPVPTPAAPTFSPAAGEYENPVEVSLACETAGAEICYTLDGSTPTTSSPVYYAPLTVNDGTSTSQYIPFFGYYADEYEKSEYIIPASQMSSLGASATSAVVLNSLTWYLSSPASKSFAPAQFKVFLKEVSGTTLGGSFIGTGGATVVYEGALDATQTTLTVNFSTPYEYHGGNLLVGVYTTTYGAFTHAFFYGNTGESGCSAYAHDGLSLDNITEPNSTNFLPKTTFTYTPNHQPIIVSKTTTVKAIAIKDGVQSDVASAEYIIKRNLFDVVQNSAVAVTGNCDNMRGVALSHNCDYLIGVNQVVAVEGTASTYKVINISDGSITTYTPSSGASWGGSDFAIGSDDNGVIVHPKHYNANYLAPWRWIYNYNCSSGSVVSAGNPIILTNSNGFTTTSTDLRAQATRVNGDINGTSSTWYLPRDKNFILEIVTSEGQFSTIKKYIVFGAGSGYTNGSFASAYRYDTNKLLICSPNGLYDCTISGITIDATNITPEGVDAINLLGSMMFKFREHTFLVRSTSDTCGASDFGVFDVTDGFPGTLVKSFKPIDGTGSVSGTNMWINVRKESDSAVTIVVFVRNLCVATYTLTENDSLICAPPTANINGGTFNAPQQISLSTTTSGGTIRYTLDGSEPNELSQEYSEPIIISSTTRLRAKTFKLGYMTSVEFDQTYNIEATPIVLTGRIELVNAEDSTIVYNGAKHYPPVRIIDDTYGELTLSSDYTISYTNNQYPGVATITATGCGEYTGTISTTFVITKAPIPTDLGEIVEVESADILYDYEPHPVTLNANNIVAGIGEATITYLKDDIEQTSPPIAPGTYVVKITFVEGDYYLAGCVENAAAFTIYGLNESDWESIKAIYYGTDGPNWSKTFNTSDVKYARQLIDNGLATIVRGRIVSLNLCGIGLSGSIPIEGVGLNALQSLDLSNNNLYGNIGSFVEPMTSLTSLNVDNNELSDLYPPLSPTITNVTLGRQVNTSKTININLKYLDKDSVIAQIPRIYLYSVANRDYNGEVSIRLMAPDNWEGTFLLSDSNFTFINTSSSNAFYGESGGAYSLDFVNLETSANGVATLLLTYEQGDANFDGEVNVVDLQAIINWIFKVYNNSKPFNWTAANVIVDERLNVQDVVGEVNLLLSSERKGIRSAKSGNELAESPIRAPKMSEEQGVPNAYLFWRNGSLYLCSPKPVSAIDITLDGNVAWDIAKYGLVMTSKDNHIVAYSLNGSTIPAGETVIATASGTMPAVLDAMLSDSDAQEIKLIFSSPTGLDNTDRGDINVVAADGGRIVIKLRQPLTDAKWVVYSANGSMIDLGCEDIINVGSKTIVNGLETGLYMVIISAPNLPTYITKIAIIR